MKRLILLISMAGFLISCSESGWKDLLDEDLSHWRTYQSYALTDEYVPFERPCDENGNPIEPRLNKAYDSGLLYHSRGECGIDGWLTWMQSHELQVIEGGTMDGSGTHLL